MLDKILEEYKDRSDIIKLLQKTQEIYGYLPITALKIISEKTGVFPSEILGIVTFYSYFRTTPQGRHIIKACHGTACHVSGAEKISSAIKESLKIKEKETTPDGLFSLENVACLGCCSLAPVIMIDKKVYGRLDVKDINGILKTYK